MAKLILCRFVTVNQPVDVFLIRSTIVKLGKLGRTNVFGSRSLCLLFRFKVTHLEHFLLITGMCLHDLL